MLKKMILITTVILGGCSSKPQAPVVINIAPSFPPQYFPNNRSGNNRNIGDSYEENNHIPETNLEEEVEADTIDNGE